MKYKWTEYAMLQAWYKLHKYVIYRACTRINVYLRPFGMPTHLKVARIRASEEERLCSTITGYVCTVALSIWNLCTT